MYGTLLIPYRYSHLCHDQFIAEVPVGNRSLAAGACPTLATEIIATGWGPRESTGSAGGGNGGQLQSEWLG